jgi:hypothetical protein
LSPARIWGVRVPFRVGRRDSGASEVSGRREEDARAEGETAWAGGRKGEVGDESGGVGWAGKVNDFGE